ncbi:hypothetical protein PR048_027415 [Dryococelus australis]|uniref:Uncharacterized protein n=1 Tax=Dryococelus australis TaxID=614101 RepID=A0ABQ9GGN8_9NEOP|nr:hypothetical protein PR048_027415 [Dryococelus australis]
MDQRVIKCLKRPYRRKLLSEILIIMELESKGLVEVLKSINIKIDDVTLLNVLQKLPNSKKLEVQDVQEWVTGGDDGSGNEVWTDEDIVQTAIVETQEEEEICKNEEGENISRTGRMKALQLAASYFEQQRD